MSGRKRGAPAGRVLAGLAAFALLALAVPLFASAEGQTVKVGNLVINVKGGFSPKRLPRDSYAPIALNAQATIRTADGTHLPAAKVFNLEFDKHGRLNTKGLPRCGVVKILNTVTEQAERLCHSAMVGSGRAGAEIEFPEQKPFFASGKLIVFNGKPKGGRPVLVFHVYAFVPAPTTFVTTARIEKAEGLYGTRVKIRVPTIVAGQGSLTFAKVRLGKSWRLKGGREHLLEAMCPTGRFYTRGDLSFADGSRLAGRVLRSCTPIG